MFCFQGVYLFRNGAKYKGFYDQGKKNGQGVFEYPDGSKYQGTLNSKMKHHIYCSGLDNQNQLRNNPPPLVSGQIP